MTEPQELRSIDELFKNTFENLPDTPAESGWDTPSERVWDHVRHNIQAPRSGWSLQSLMILTGFAVVLAVGLYFAFTSTEQINTNPADAAAPAVAAPVIAAPVAEVPAAVPAPVTVPTPEVVGQQKTNKRQLKTVAKTSPVEKMPAPVKPLPEAREPLRSNGASPLPGSNEIKIPNTTEALKIERAKELEKLWRTPLDFLPVPRTNTPNK
jgi:hypothetical protein